MIVDLVLANNSAHLVGISLYYGNSPILVNYVLFTYDKFQLHPRDRYAVQCVLGSTSQGY